MCINYFVSFFSMAIVLSSIIHCKDVNDTLTSNTQSFVNVEWPLITGLTNENKLMIYRDIKNQINPRPQWGFPFYRQLNFPTWPSFYLTPPKIQRYDLYSSYKNLIDKKPKIVIKTTTTTTTPKYQSEENSLEESPPTYTRDHAPLEKSEEEEDSESEEEENENQEVEKSNSKGRVNFHVHGHEGPDTYAFGYDTGNGNNRQFRYEERHENGTVTGHYGYYDARGKLRKVHYTSHPSIGYETIPSIE